MQTSGLYDVFFPLWEKIMADPAFMISTREAITWGKQHMKPVAKPGTKHYYTDTNYYLLGFIVESVTGKPFYQAMHEMIFDTLGMSHAWMHGYSIWKPRIIPLLMPSQLYCWGCVGVTGAFMFFHPGTESYIIGTFNDFAYRGKTLTFMAQKVIKVLVES